MVTKQKLDDLPGSDDKDFWLDADVNSGIVPHGIFDDHKHYFKRVKGHQAQCKGCGWGFELDPGDLIEKGHLYDKTNKFVI